MKSVPPDKSIPKKEDPRELFSCSDYLFFGGNVKNVPQAEQKKREIKFSKR